MKTKIEQPASAGRMPLLVGLLVMPVRIAVAVTIFAPILLVLSLLQKLGEWLDKTFDTLADNWLELGREWQYLTNGKQHKQIIEALRENQTLKEQLRLLSDQPNIDVVARAKKPTDTESE